MKALIRQQSTHISCHPLALQLLFLLKNLYFHTSFIPYSVADAVLRGTKLSTSLGHYHHPLDDFSRLIPLTVHEINLYRVRGAQRPPGSISGAAFPHRAPSGCPPCPSTTQPKPFWSSGQTLLTPAREEFANKVRKKLIASEGDSSEKGGGKRFSETGWDEKVPPSVAGTMRLPRAAA